MKTAKPVFANAGVESAYRKKLRRLVTEMQASAIYWLTAAYNKQESEVAEAMAQDATPALIAQRYINKLIKKWQKIFDEKSRPIAEDFTKRIFDASDYSAQKFLADAGFTVQFKMNPAYKDSFAATMAENVDLIKSIPAKYFQEIQGAVMRNYIAGRDFQTMVKAIKKIGGVTDKRAKLIARDQSNKATAALTRLRYVDAGIQKAIWMHSHAGKEPRISHVKADGKEFDIVKGCLIDGEYILPGEKINCRCSMRPVITYTNE